MPEQSVKQETVKLSEKAKGFLVYSKVYRVIAFIAAFFGFIISGFIYDHISDGNFLVFFERPIVVLYIFIPFIPATIFAYIASGKVKKFEEQAEEEGVDIKALREGSKLYSHRKKNED